VAIRFELTHDAEEFAARAQAHLAARIERNILATLVANVQGGVAHAAPPLFALGLDSRGEVAAAVMRIPPFPLLASELGVTDDEAGTAARALVPAWLARDPSLPGVGATTVTARAIAAAWSAQTGRPTRCRMREAMHALTEVRDPPRPAAGWLRFAEPQERALLGEWLRDFVHEAGVDGIDQADAIVERQIVRRRLFLWEDAGIPRCYVSVSAMVAGTVRLGPVYTPPEDRCRGYASSAVAAVSRRLLGSGADRCMLLTDLSNPTSNKIYADVGYERFGSWEDYAFG
jgi:predicted GNAT family acetyltransferase